jgi:hypothetical protein
LKFLDRLMKRWGFDPIDWLVTDAEAVRRLDEERPNDLSVCNEAAIGLAFAVIKSRAACPADVVERALAALTRTAMLVERSTLRDEVKAEWRVAVEKMRTKLKSL